MSAFAITGIMFTLESNSFMHAKSSDFSLKGVKSFYTSHNTKDCIRASSWTDKINTNVNSSVMIIY